MSLNIWSDRRPSVVASCCFCAQLSPVWRFPGIPRDLLQLGAHADPECRRCDGTGVEVDIEEHVMSVRERHAAEFVRLLGLPEPPGTADILTVRRACAFALRERDLSPDQWRRVRALLSFARDEWNAGATSLRFQ